MGNMKFSSAEGNLNNYMRIVKAEGTSNLMILPSSCSVPRHTFFKRNIKKL